MMDETDVRGKLEYESFAPCGFKANNLQTRTIWWLKINGAKSAPPKCGF
jgi:hypothetical protein